MAKEKLKILFKKNIIVIGLIAAIIIYFLVFDNSNKQIVIPPPLVEVAKPKVVAMAEYITQTGNTVSINSVDLVARVEGYLTELNFTDGTFVKKGKQLFVIEPEPYLEKLNEAKASLLSAKASNMYASAEYKRQQDMYKQNATSLNSVEVWRSKQEQAKADVDKAKANLVIAEINYGYTHVNAPFTGRIGRHLVDVGNLVGNAKATRIATIEELNPIYVYFNLSELDLIRVRKAARAQGFDPKDISKVPVEVGLQTEVGFPHKGHLDFVNTGLNASTGTLQFRAVLPNKDYTLLPGFFVKVKLNIENKSPKLTVPNTAVLSDQIGPYLLVVNKDDEVSLNRVKLGSVENGRQAIIKGITPKDRIIINGIQNATPGKKVTVKELSEAKGE